MEEINLYAVLEVERGATQEEIKKAYRNKAKLHHEDKGGDNETMVLINRAYAILKDEMKRKHYDETGQENAYDFQQKFANLVQQLFFKVISENHSIEHVDLIKKFKKEVSTQLEAQEKQLEEADAAGEKLQKVIDRLTVKQGENRIGAILEMNMDNFRKHKKTIEINICFFKDCLEAIDHYEYAFEGDGEGERDPLWRNIRFGNMNTM